MHYCPDLVMIWRHYYVSNGACRGAARCAFYRYKASLLVQRPKRAIRLVDMADCAHREVVLPAEQDDAQLLRVEGEAADLMTARPPTPPSAARQLTPPTGQARPCRLHATASFGHARVSMSCASHAPRVSEARMSTIPTMTSECCAASEASRIIRVSARKPTDG